MKSVRSADAGNVAHSVQRVLRAPAYADQERQRVAGIVGNMLRVLFVVICVTLVVQFAISGLASGMFGLVASAAWVLGLLTLLRRGYVQATALLLILNLMLLVNVSSIGYGGIQSPTVSANLLVILMAIMLIPPRRVLIVAILVIACLVAVYWIDVSGLDQTLPFPQTPNTPEMALMTHIAHLLGAGYFLYLAVNGLTQAIHRARAEERRANELLEQAQAARSVAEQAHQAKVQFLANMSHELRTPLNAVIGYSEMLLEDGETHDELQRIHGAGTHLLGLISDILDLSKIESGRMLLDIQEFSPKQLAEQALADVHDLVDQTGIELRLELVGEVSDDAFTILADRLRVHQILRNLLDNAAKFTDRGYIDLIVRPDEETSGHLVFCVRDTGIGIATDVMRRIFEPFYQVDGSSTRLRGGTGLGLGLSRALAEMMGAKLSVVSRLGEGSAFSLYLPKTPPLTSETDSAVAPASE